ncbi:cytochrome P450 [Sphingomonas sp. BAUL-RG-20F-R05-02]|uniref:cytochrome P450 n=1 Tax=Sphingomonas sp. BAUL-RG-20F-R05-02 TaxID=2914830 RepID=UPI001F55FC00|nr:cytochrome P450 [Sphingomonas sp. BAUL-RG-20F-R05-02]
MATVVTGEKPNDMQASFDKVSSNFGGLLDDPMPLYRAKMNESPVMKGDILEELGVPPIFGNARGRQVYTLFRHSDVGAVLRDQDTYTSGLIGEGLGTFMGTFMLTAMDGDYHRRMRSLLQPCFMPPVLKEWRAALIDPVIRNEYVAPLVPRGKADLIADMGLGFPVRVIYAILGFPDGDQKGLEIFASMALKILAGPKRSPEEAARARVEALEASRALHDYVLPLVAERRRQGSLGNDLIGRLLRTEHEGETLSDEQVTDFVRMLLPAAAETTTRTFGSLMVLLLERPALLDQIRQDRSLLSKAIDEAVRLEPVATFKAREAARDVEIGGVAIPKGSIVSMVVHAANRDETVFDDPDTFDIFRRNKPSFGFGYGVHMCIGLFVAKAEIESAVNAIFDLLPNVRFDPSKPKPEIKGVGLRGPKSVNVVWDTTA